MLRKARRHISFPWQPSLSCLVSGVTCAGFASLKLRPSPTALCEDDKEVSYYGSYRGDRFGGGTGRRLGIDESGKKKLPGTGVSRVVLISETHGKLREWATEENWKKATAVHKAAYFTRSENLVQEEVLQRIRQHYTSTPEYLDSVRVDAALFRLEDPAEFHLRCDSRTVTRLPMVVLGKFDEKNERCVVDFANKRLGGGWLSYGMVQEEKMFIERFDYGALCARSLLEMEIDPVKEPVASPFSMHENEAWILRGGREYANLGWYGRTPRHAMDLVELVNPLDDADTVPTVIAIDAIKADFQRYNKKRLEKMLIKAYTGFIAANIDEDVGGQKLVATGSWGCGAFFNNECVMFVVQALAANLAGVNLTHHVLGDGRRLGEAFKFLEDVMLRKLTVSSALQELADLCESSPEKWTTKFKPRAKL